MPELWASTVNTIEAACLGTVGVEVKLDRTILAGGGPKALEGEIKVRWHLKGGDHSGMDTRLAALRSRFASGELEREEPNHRLLACYRGVRCFQRILDLQKSGRSIVLRQAAGSEQWQYELGGVGLPGRHKVGPVATTGNLAMAASLGVVGIPLAELEGPNAGRHKYYFPVTGFEPKKGEPGAQTVDYMRGWTDHSLAAREPENPFLYAMHAILNWRKFTREAREMVANLALLKPNSKKGAILREDSTGKEHDRVSRFFGR